MTRTAAILALIPFLPHVFGQAPQVTITIAIPYCSTDSVPLSSLIPGYSSALTSYGSMSSIGPSSLSPDVSISDSSSTTPDNAQTRTSRAGNTAASSGTAISDESSSGALIGGGSTTLEYETTSTSVIIPSATASAYVDQLGQTYTVQTNTGASGNTIDQVANRNVAKRQEDVTIEESLEECIESCSLTPACVAMSLLGTSCLLYSSVDGTLFLLGGQVAFNMQRFTGFGDEAAPESSTAVNSSTTATLPTQTAGGSSALLSTAVQTNTPVTTTTAPGPDSVEISGSSSSVVQSSTSSSTPASMTTDISSSQVSFSGLSSSAPEAFSSRSTSPITTSGITPSWWSQAPSSTILSFWTPSIISTTPRTSDSGQSSSAAFYSSDLAEPSPSTSQGNGPSLWPSIQPSDSSVSTVDVSSSLSSTSTPQVGTSTVIVTPIPSSLASSAPTISSEYTQLSSSTADNSDTSKTSIVTRSELSTTSVVDSLTLSSSAAMPTSTIPTFVCPDNNGTVVTDVNSVQYYLMCESDITGYVFGSAQAARSFNECFDYCDSAGECTGFAYSGVADGAGAGDCYLKNGTVSIVSSDEMHIAAIRWTPFQPTSSLQMTSSTSEAAPGVTSTSGLSSALVVISSDDGSVFSSTVITTPESSVSTTSGTLSTPSVSSSVAAISTTWATTTTTTSLSSSSSSSPSSPSSSGTSTSSLVTPTTTTTTTRTTTTTTSTSTTRTTTTTTSTTTTRTTTTTTTTSTTSRSATTSSSSTSAVSSPTPVVNNGKRGLCYTNGSYTLPYSLSGQNSQVSWGYNWFYSRYSDSKNITNPAMRFIPLLFSDDPSLLAAWPSAAQAALDEGADALMSFNEPDLCVPNAGAACMTVNAAVTAYKSHMQPFAGQTRLGAPAVTDGGGLEWLHQFMGNCTGCTVDFINLHWYSNVYAFSYLQYYVQRAYAEFGLPIWVTEFGMDGSSYNSDVLTQAFLKNAVSWLDAVPYVERYAWFINGPGYLLNADGSGLSAQGMIYNSYTAPCANWTNTEGHC